LLYFDTCFTQIRWLAVLHYRTIEVRLNNPICLLPNDLLSSLFASSHLFTRFCGADCYDKNKSFLGCLQEGSCIGLLIVYDGRHTQNDFVFNGTEHTHAVFAFAPFSIKVVFEFWLRSNGSQCT
jgi:hypothetical protein